ncbi:MAG: hypothetical protein IIA68_05120 [Proteobacteria bacterium]|nr:hypothetical protein [Pseudomonadota bacterium]
MRSLLALLFAVPLLLGAPALVDAAGKNKGKAGPVPTVTKGKNQGQSGDVATDRLLGTVISAVERALIGDYIKKAKVKHKGLPPGLAKRQHLPPGLQKHIARTGRLPPGLEKRRLPGDLRSLLPIRSGQDYRVVGNDIVLIEIATELILDVMQGVLR